MMIVYPEQLDCIARIVPTFGQHPNPAVLFDPKAYSRPFTIARLEHHRRRHGEMEAWAAMLNEDSLVTLGKVKSRIKRILRGSKAKT
jgi:hypothetical protein